MLYMDRLRDVLAVAFLCVYLFSTHEIHSVEGKRNLFKKYYDNEYDCVDFYKQPAFNHPLLANHTFHPEMRPSWTPKPTISKVKQSLNMRSQFKGCPTGTVPIRRISKEDIKRERSLVEKYRSEYSMLTAENPGTHYAIVKTRWNSTQKYIGAGANISTWSPLVQSSQYSYSTTQIVLSNGNENIQVGWTVNPTVYGVGSGVHSFIFTTTGTTLCFNTYCPGFVILNKDMPIDGPLPASTLQGPKFGMQYDIYKEAEHWWLSFNYEPMGFWPKNIFSGDLANTATSIQWGGQVYSPPGERSPPMGNSYYISDGHDAYCANLTMINEAREIVGALDVDVIADSLRYQIDHYGWALDPYSNYIVYGGPGGETKN